MYIQQTHVFFKKMLAEKNTPTQIIRKVFLIKFLTANDMIVKLSQEGKLYLFCPTLKCSGFLL